jgi:phosphate transport system substrate-binding protein
MRPPVRISEFVVNLAAFVAVLAAVPACGQVVTGAQVVKVDGSSTVYPITNAVAKAFQSAKGNAIKVMVGVSGTGGGFKKFCRGETDVSDASRPILREEMQICRAAGIEYLELPVAFDALTVVVNPKNAFLHSITVDELKRMWEPAAQGKLTRWRQINAAWPDAPIRLFGPGAASGTFDYFTEAIVGKAKSSRTDYTASEDDNVLVQGVARNVDAMGYFGYSYYSENKNRLRAVSIAEKPGRAGVEPSLETVISGSYRPLSRPMFIYASVKSLGRPEVHEFVRFYLKNAGRLAKEVKCVPLPERAYSLAADNLDRMKIGTVFGGVAEVGVTIEELLRREARP